MSDKHVWLITGAGRGLGADIAKVALAASHAQDAPMTLVCPHHAPMRELWIMPADQV